MSKCWNSLNGPATGPTSVVQKSRNGCIVSVTYRMLGQKQRYAGYRAYVAQGNSEDILKYYNNGNMTSVLGERSFREDLKEREEELEVSGDLSKSGVPPFKWTQGLCCRCSVFIFTSVLYRASVTKFRMLAYSIIKYFDVFEYS